MDCGVWVKSKSNGRNADRPNGKAWKKKPKDNRKTGHTQNGYTAAKLQIRLKKRAG